jgi:peptidoglycan/LPS O-acetylase OafA/YrhL
VAGERSYGIYLVNMGVIRALRSVLPLAQLERPMMLLVQLLAAGLILVLADAAYRLVEVPSRRMIRALECVAHRFRDGKGADGMSSPCRVPQHSGACGWR